MANKQWEEVKAIVDKLLKQAGPYDEEQIGEACNSNEQLIKLVAIQLKSIKESEDSGFLEHLAADQKTFIEDLDVEIPDLGENLIGRRFGPFKITKQLGEGGMGCVYKAERVDESFHQTVAIKVINRNVRSDETLYRFNNEREILARLNHPHIARLYDGGLSSEAIPFLIMEYVDGVPIDEWCALHSCSLDQKLRLFKDVCRAVQYAHNNMVIHRDLKPQNILVNQEGQVKILDFGIAKLIDGETALYQTQAGRRLWTPQYAAPEQIMCKETGISVDVYALGGLLYKLLTGRPPYNFSGKSTYEVETIIKDEDPLLPSMNIDDEAVEEAQQNKLKRKLQGDLDALILKAMRRQPAFRYNSVNDILDDLRRYISGRPLHARKDTIQYRSAKFWQRHKTSVVAAIIVAGITLGYLFQLARERDRAQLQAEKAQAVSVFLTDLFRSSNPTYEPGKVLTANMLLARGKERIEQLKEQPAVQAQLLSVIGRAYLHLGQYDQAKIVLTQGLNLREELYDADSPELAMGFFDFADLQRVTGNFAAAESLHRKALAIRKSSLGEFNEQTAESLKELGLLLTRMQKYHISDSLLSEALKIYRRISPDNNKAIAAVLNSKAYNYRYSKEYGKAHELYQKAFNLWKKEYGNLHPQVAEGANDLAMINKQEGNLAVADSLYQFSLNILTQLYDGSHPNIALVLDNLGSLRRAQGNVEDAEFYYKKALSMSRSLFKPNHPRIASYLNNLASLYFAMEKYQEAEKLWLQVVEIDKVTRGKKHVYVGGDFLNLGKSYLRQANYQKAKMYLNKGLVIFDEHYSTDAPLISILLPLGNVQMATGNTSEALSIFERVLKIQEKALKKGDWRIGRTKMFIGANLLEQKKYTLAEQMLKTGYQILKKQKGPEYKLTTQCKNYLTELYRRTGRTALITTIDADK